MLGAPTIMLDASSNTLLLDIMLDAPSNTLLLDKVSRSASLFVGSWGLKAQTSTFGGATTWVKK